MPGIDQTMNEYKKGTLRSGSKQGPVVKSKKQAIAIGLAETRKAGAKGAKKVGKKRRPNIADALSKKISDHRTPT